MKPVAIIRHVAHEGPGHLVDVLERHAVPWRLFAIDEGDRLPDDGEAFSALVSMGGPMSANDDLPWIPHEIGLIRQARAAGIPILGHCLGAQLIARALGGSVVDNGIEEIGWHPVGTVDDGDRDWSDGLPERFDAFHWHGERCTLPDGARPLLANAHCPVQGFTMDGILALQCHLEMTAPLVEDWVDRHRDHLADHPSPAVQSPAAILDGLETRIARLQDIADTLYGRWIERIAPRGA